MASFLFLFQHDNDNKDDEEDDADDDVMAMGISQHTKIHIFVAKFVHGYDDDDNNSKGDDCDGDDDQAVNLNCIFFLFSSLLHCVLKDNDHICNDDQDNFLKVW